MVFSDTELEKGLLALVLMNTDTADEVLQKIDVDDFSTRETRYFYRIIRKMYDDNGNISRTKFLIAAKKNVDSKKVMEIVESHYINPLEMDEIITQLNSFKEKRAINQALKDSYSLIDSEKSIEEIKSEIQDKIFRATSNHAKSKMIFDASEIVEQSYDQWMKRSAGEKERKIKTGIPSLDMITGGGLTPKHLMLIAASTSTGKTAFALNIVRSLLKKKQSVFIISLEMDKVEVMDRLVVMDSHVPTDIFQRKTRVEGQAKAIMDSYEFFNNAPWKIADERGLSVADIKALSRQAKRDFNSQLGLIVIDYLTEIDIKPIGGNYAKPIGEAVREIRSLAGELEVPIILIHQINREYSKRKDPTPRLSDLRDSGEIEEKADEIVFIHRPQKFVKRGPGEEEPQIQEDAEVIIAKQRTGVTGTLSFTWHSRLLTFADNYIDGGNLHYQ